MKTKMSSMEKEILIDAMLGMGFGLIGGLMYLVSVFIPEELLEVGMTCATAGAIFASIGLGLIGMGIALEVLK